MLHINTSHACVVPITIPEQVDQEKVNTICGKKFLTCFDRMCGSNHPAESEQTRSTQVAECQSQLTTVLPSLHQPGPSINYKQHL